MASQAEKYRSKNPILDDKFFNDRFLDIDQRLVSAEAALSQLGEIRDQLVSRGLQEVQAQISASIVEINQQITTAAAQIAAGVNDFTALKDELETFIGGLEGQVDAVQAQIDAILESANFTASSVLVSAIPGMTATNVQAALAEHQSDVNELKDRADDLETDVQDHLERIEVVELRLSGLGENYVVPNLVSAQALDQLTVGDVVHIEDNGSGAWERWQMMDVGPTTWVGQTKVKLSTQGEAPADHMHNIEDVADLQGALDDLDEDKLDVSAYTAADVLTKVKSVDGVGSGLDADLWQGANKFVSTASPSGGSNGDVWFQIEA